MKCKKSDKNRTILPHQRILYQSEWSDGLWNWGEGGGGEKERAKRHKLCKNKNIRYSSIVPDILSMTYTITTFAWCWLSVIYYLSSINFAAYDSVDSRPVQILFSIPFASAIILVGLALSSHFCNEMFLRFSERISSDVTSRKLSKILLNYFIFI